jgi:hypothetical protein
MSFYNGPTIVTNGLVLSLDAADRNSYTENVYPNPTDIFAYVGAAGGNNCTLSRDTTIDLSPAGGTPLKMAITGNDPYTNAWASTTYSFVSASAGQTWTFSCWIKASTNTDAQLFMFGANSSGANVETYVVTFTNITTTWQRFSITRQLQNNNTVALQVRFDGTGSGGNGINIWFDGAQVERNSLLSPFNNKTNWFDLTGGGNNGTLTNGPTFNSANGGSIVFDGSNDYINSTSISSQLTTNITAEAWIYVTSNPSDYVRIIGTGGNTGNRTFGLWYDTSRRLLWQRNGGNDPSIYPSSPTLQLNRWHHVCATTSGTSHVLYLDSVSIGTATASGPWAASNENITMGYAGFHAYITGRISMGKIYNRGLSQAEVLQNYNVTKSRFGL